MGALFHAEVGFNLQSDKSANDIGKGSKLYATNYFMHGLTGERSHVLTLDELGWIKSHFTAARSLLDDERFQVAVHCLASYRWHSVPRAKLAVLWAGIEGIFGITSEVRFRVSLYIARFLQPNNLIERQNVFNFIKKLYDLRSTAVHGSKMKENVASGVDDSAEILRKILLQCIVNKGLPRENELVP